MSLVGQTETSSRQARAVAPRPITDLARWTWPWASFDSHNDRLRNVGGFRRAEAKQFALLFSVDRSRRDYAMLAGVQTVTMAA
jgi:hypothetical protein